VVGVTLGGSPLPSGDDNDAAALHYRLTSGAPIDARVVAGERPGSAPWLRIRDARERTVLALRPDGPDLIVNYRANAASLTLDQPAPRARGALRHQRPGDTIHVVVIRSGSRRCAFVEERRFCGIGPRPGEGWKLISYGEPLAGWLEAGLDASWVLLLFAPLGIAGALDRRSAGAVAAALGVLYVAPVTLALERPALHELAGALAGVAIPVLLRGRLLPGSRPSVPWAGA
jgi:hypothetical protein